MAGRRATVEIDPVARPAGQVGLRGLCQRRVQPERTLPRPSKRRASPQFLVRRVPRSQSQKAHCIACYAIPTTSGDRPKRHPLRGRSSSRSISQEIFDRVQDLLHTHNTAGEKRRVHEHYLKGSVYCGECGSRLCITKAVNRHGSEYLYFFCLGNYRNLTSASSEPMPVELVEVMSRPSGGRSVSLPATPRRSRP